MVRELVDAHIEEQKKSAVDVLGDRSYMLNTVKIKIEARLKQITDDMRAKQINLNLDGGGVGRMGMKDMELSKLVQEWIESQLMYEKALSFFKATSSAVQNGQDPPGLDRFIQMNYPFLTNDKYQLKSYQIERDVALDSGGAENSRYKALAKRCDMMEADYNKQMAEARAKGQIAILEELQQDMNGSKSKMEGLQAKVENLKAEIGDLNNSLVLYLTLQEEQRGLREQLKTVREQIENVMALQGTQAASTVQWKGQPEKPLNKSFPKLWMTMTLAVVLGLGLSLGVAFLREATDQSIRSPRDIAKVGQINLLGIIPDESDDPQSAGARLPVVIFDAPHSIMAESFRHIRTKLQHTASLDTTRSIMVTSPAPGDGKTTIACNLAAGLALNGRRILLVDANFRRPEIHKIFGLSNEQGFSDVLNAVAAFDEVIQETQVPNLAVMSAGPKPMNPTELFESQLLIDFIERALEEFDHVIFDSGPIMVVAEAQAMAPRVDGVISVVRAKTNNRGLLQRMRDELRRNKAEHLGVVLNAVRAQGGGYYARNIQTYYGYDSNGHG
jgi:tyrosine-protein kinase Etk/Wzc